MPPKKNNADAFEFDENQIVLAYFGKVLYEAKVRLEIEIDAPNDTYALPPCPHSHILWPCADLDS